MKAEDSLAEKKDRELFDKLNEDVAIDQEILLDEDFQRRKSQKRHNPFEKKKTKLIFKT